MPRLEIVDDGVIYRNPNPGYQYVFASHPHPVQLSEHELICIYQRGQALYSTDLILAQARSTDGGRTWHDEGPVWSQSKDDRLYSYHGPFPTRFRDGRLVIAAFRVDRTDPDRPLFNEATAGLAATETILFHSTDNGRTWSPPQPVPHPDDLVITPSSNILELPDSERHGREWFFPFDQWHAFDAPGPYRPRTVALFSSDQGQTWGNPVSYADGSAFGKGFWHGRIIQLADGRLFTLFWSANMGTGEHINLHRSLADPDGRAWSDPEPTNLLGQTNWPVDLGGGRLAVVYTSRESSRPGFFAALSHDEGRTWDLDHQIRLWDATGREKLGVHAPDAYPRSHDTIAFGAPNALRLANGEILASYWCTEMSITHIRYTRLRVV